MTTNTSPQPIAGETTEADTKPAASDAADPAAPETPADEPAPGQGAASALARLQEQEKNRLRLDSTRP